MVFIVGVMYDLASTLELKSKGLPYADVFLNSDIYCFYRYRYTLFH